MKRQCSGDGNVEQAKLGRGKGDDGKGGKDGGLKKSEEPHLGGGSGQQLQKANTECNGDGNVDQEKPGERKGEDGNDGGKDGGLKGSEEPHLGGVAGSNHRNQTPR